MKNFLVTAPVQIFINSISSGRFTSSEALSGPAGRVRVLPFVSQSASHGRAVRRAMYDTLQCNKKEIYTHHIYKNGAT